MEAPEEVAMGSKDHSNIVKGKRTKRLRPQSPIPFAITSNNSIHNGDGGEFDGIPNVEDMNHTQYLSTSSSFSSEYHSTEEEEDMANCLILLAQGQSRESAKLQPDDHHKFTSRRFMEAASNGTGKAGYYVYECKTCNRTFPSFQALGGHRASHKKPKAASAAAMVEEKIRQFTAAAAAAASDEEEGKFIKTNNISSLSLELSNHNNNNRGLYGNNNKAKVHECSVCGAEFTSGQALGGHMRRHRGPIGTTANTALSLTVPMATESQEPQKPRNVLSLDLDLNLPAPEDDHHHQESKLPLAPKQQQQQQKQQSRLVFTAPTLVDCHY
ncbi:zinc finger protein ZAT5-like [Durio zibethinus]|uniref:Zinc finger protein ZAT5-like n=1 Tax=Durio zibethinus TaxID=66656 RepID=A0A6P6AIH8_DURZI|nr:zinc finger protein ZAT5-like [Durio zibethinus]